MASWITSVVFVTIALAMRNLQLCEKSFIALVWCEGSELRIAYF